MYEFLAGLIIAAARGFEIPGLLHPMNCLKKA